jgi:hypothetical protein
MTTTCETVVHLPSGDAVTLRAMEPEDEVALERFHEGLSPETTRLRFFATHPHLSHEELHRFTHLDHRDREAFVARDGERIIAVGRFDRLASGTDAEIAVFRQAGLPISVHFRDGVMQVTLELETARVSAAPC